MRQGASPIGRNRGMAIGPLEDFKIKQAGNWTIMRLGGATVANYGRTRYRLQKALDGTKDKAQRELLGSMLSDCDFALEWLKTGRRPGTRRGVERAYKVSSWDPAWLEAYHSPNGWSVQRERRDLTADERFRIEDAMRDLTDRERQCFMMYHVDGMSEYDIAQELHLGRSTVQTYLERAKEKIEYAKMSSLFLLE